MHPVLFHFKGITLYTYGFFVALAMAASLISAEKRAKRFGFEAAMVADVLFVGFIGGIVGARAMYVVFNFEDYSRDLWAMLRIQEGGLIWYGGFFGAALFGVLYAQWRGWPILRLCDFFAPIAAMAHGIGRIGCFFNGCCYGLTTASLGKLPTPLYESAGLILIAMFLFRYSRRALRPGRVFLAYILMYASLRFFLEFLRGDNIHYFNLTLAQWTSLALLLSAGVFFIWQKKQK